MDTVFDFVRTPHIFVEDRQVLIDNPVLRVEQIYVNYSKPNDDADLLPENMRDIEFDVSLHFISDRIDEYPSHQATVINECIGLISDVYVIDGKNYVFYFFINACPYLAEIGVIEKTNISARDLQRYFGMPIVVNQLQQGARRSRGSPDFEPSLLSKITGFF